ncbi:MAG: hypothetical protein QOI80_1906 [Solirubrobacteraceae bacterium]|nr:hypothetical protein [Solirubrobacteraceae bacterium]
MAATLSAERLSPAERALVADALRRRRGAAGPQPRDRSQPAPLSFSQLRLWFLQQWAPQAPTFNAARAFRLRGPLDADALQRALSGVAERHESLRTVFLTGAGAEPHQHTLASAEIALPCHELAGPADADVETRVQAQVRELSRAPFDLASDHMMRAALIRIGAEDHVLVLGIHHIAGDAASTIVLYDELGTLYAAACDGRPHGLPAPAIQFADFAVWQRERLQGQRLADLTAYWTAQLEGAPAVLDLPLDRPRPDVPRHEGAHRHFALPGDVAAGIATLARDEQATAYMVTLAAFATLLYRLSGQDDVVVGSPIANRTHAELADMIGFLSNTVALRVRLDGNPSFRTVVERTRETVLGALAHQEMPFEQVVTALKLPRDAAHNPVFQVNFRAQSAPPVPALRGLEVEALAVDVGYARFDLALELRFGADALAGYVEYDVDLFDPATIEALVAALGELLHQITADPDIPILAIALPALRRTQKRPARRPRPSRGRRAGITEPEEP